MKDGHAASSIEALKWDTNVALAVKVVREAFGFAVKGSAKHAGMYLSSVTRHSCFASAPHMETI